MHFNIDLLPEKLVDRDLQLSLIDSDFDLMQIRLGNYTFFAWPVTRMNRKLWFNQTEKLECKYTIDLFLGN